MQESQDEAARGAASKDAGAAIEPGKRALVAAAVGAVALTAVMLLMLLAARRSPPPVVVEASGSDDGNVSPHSYARYIEVDHFGVRAQTNALGSRELLVRGHVRNGGPRAVVAADLRCHFPAHSGGRVHFDFPLVVDSRLDDLGEGPLPPMSGRDFAVRMGEFPDELAPEIPRIEVVNIRLQDT